MDKYALISIGLSSALGLVISTLIFGKKPEKVWLCFFITLILCIGLNSISLKLILPKIVANKIDSCLQRTFTEIPAFKTLKEYEPAAYENIVISLKRYFRNHANEEEAAYIVQTEIASVMDAKIAKSSDDALINYANFLITAMEELQNQGQDLCFNFVFEKQNRLETVKHLSKSTQILALKQLDNVIKTYDTGRTIPTDAEVDAFLSPLYQELAEKYGDDVGMLEHPHAGKVNKSRACAIMLDIYQKILALNPGQSAQALRWTFAD